MSTNTHPTPLSTDPEALMLLQRDVRKWKEGYVCAMICVIFFGFLLCVVSWSMGSETARLTEAIRDAEANARSAVMTELEDAAVHHRSFYTAKYRIQCAAFQRRTRHE